MLHTTKIILFIGFVLFFVIKTGIGTLFSQDKINDDKELFEKVRHTYTVHLPSRWLAFVQGKQLSESLAKIPKQAYCKPNKSLSVLYMNVRNQGDLLVVQNAKNPYVMRFQNQLNLYRGVRFFVNFEGSFNELTQRAVWKRIKKNKSHHIVKVRKRFLSEDRYFLLFFDSKQFLLRRIEQYQSGKKRASVNIKYQREQQFYLISDIHIRDELSINKRVFSLSFSRYQLGDKVNPEWLIRLQNDCSSIS